MLDGILTDVNCFLFTQETIIWAPILTNTEHVYLHNGALFSFLNKPKNHDILSEEAIFFKSLWGR